MLFVSPASQGDAEWCLILEDDAHPIHLDRLRQVQVPADADFIFVNDRMCLDRRTGSERDVPRCFPVEQALGVLDTFGVGVGGDGYLLKRSGAERLVKVIETDLCYGHVDWRLLRYGLDLNRLPPGVLNSDLGYVLRNHHNPARPPAYGILHAYCLDVPLVLRGAFQSSRMEANDAN